MSERENELERTVAELREAQVKLAHAGKLAAIGQLASGVAHEINNPATAVMATLDVVAREVAVLRRTLESMPEPPAHCRAAVRTIERFLTDAGHAMDRIRLVTADLRTFARQDTGCPEPVDLNAVVEAACRLLGPVSRTRGTLTLRPGEGALVHGHAGRLGQVVANLVTNAMQALEEHDGPREVVVSTRRDGEHVILAVDDSGPGIPPEVRGRIFEPFFTTKEPGAGTGLGLSLVKEIVEAYGGTVRVGDSPAGGACIEVRLPAREGPIERPRVRRADAGARRRLLLIDDETALLAALGAALSEGAEVVTAVGGEAALARLAQDRSFDLVLCDLHMKGMDGADVRASIGDSAPELLDRLVFMTGGAVSEKLRAAVAEAGTRVLPKPFRPADVYALLADEGGVSGTRAP